MPWLHWSVILFRWGLTQEATMRHGWNMQAQASQVGRAPVLLALAIGDWVKEVVPEATLSLLSIQHELQGLALVWPQLHSQTLHMHAVSSTWHHAGHDCRS